MLPSFHLVYTGSLAKTTELFGAPAMVAGLVNSLLWLMHSIIVVQSGQSIVLLLSHALIAMTTFSHLMSICAEKRATRKGYILGALFFCHCKQIEDIVKDTRKGSQKSSSLLGSAFYIVEIILILIIWILGCFLKSFEIVDDVEDQRGDLATSGHLDMPPVQDATQQHQVVPPSEPPNVLGEAPQGSESSDMAPTQGVAGAQQHQLVPDEQEVENQYYNSKGMVETDPEGALAGFDQVVKMEPEKAEWGFKALKQTVKLYYKLGKYKEMMDAYREMLTYIKSTVTRNYSGKCINNIMDFVSGSASQNFSPLQEFYQTTLKLLKKQKMRLWFKTNLKLCKIWFDMGEYGRMSKILKELHKSCQREDGSDDQKKGTQLLEVYAIEIQMYTETKNNKKLKELYQRVLTIKSAIPHPRIMGIIRECGGKMHMAERQWAEAATDFFEAFKNYNEAGNPRRIQCLKYLVLANMSMESELNPFDGQEAKPYKNDPEILAMTNLVAAYQKNDIMEFEKILKSNRRTIMDDRFIRNYIEDLLKNIRTQALFKLIKPYTRIRIPFISQELNVPEKDVGQLLVSLILDNRIPGHIDQVNKLLERGDRPKGMRKYNAIDKWDTQLKSIYQTVSNRVG
ncbi:unnamed protein product [Urochloa decumbens]|uniref:COP9 signalosome complex subunit 2 n=1 Tax=Urochloa decumbens TaxID=240449 RepID=A0ABC9HDP9_9POAL